jgi:16S rRNA processing protein RimM
MKSDFYAIGQIVKSTGLKGALVVRPLTDYLQRFHALKRVWVGTSDSDRSPFQVEEASVKGQTIYLRFEDVHTRDAAEAFAGKLLYVTEDDLVRLPEGTHFVHDIVGSQVTDEKGKEIGIVKEVWKLPANDVYVIRGRRREHLVPAIDSVIEKIDTERKLIQIRTIEEM